MALKPFEAFKRQIIIAVTLLGTLFIANSSPADTAHHPQLVRNQPNIYSVIVAQNETQDGGKDKNEASSEKKEAESSSDENQKSSEVKKRPLKEFQPSERIEAEQAVDFPYDI